MENHRSWNLLRGSTILKQAACSITTLTLRKSTINGTIKLKSLSSNKSLLSSQAQFVRTFYMDATLSTSVRLRFKRGSSLRACRPTSLLSWMTKNCSLKVIRLWLVNEVLSFQAVKSKGSPSPELWSVSHVFCCSTKLPQLWTPSLSIRSNRLSINWWSVTNRWRSLWSRTGWAPCATATLLWSWRRETLSSKETTMIWLLKMAHTENLSTDNWWNQSWKS